MYFEESVSIQEALGKVVSTLFPDIRNKSEVLIKQNSILFEADADLTLSLTKLNKDFEGLSRMFELLLVPAVSKCLQSTNCKQPFNGFTVLRASHERQHKQLQELRDSCNKYVMNEDWEEDKKQLCTDSYRLETSYLTYFNFMESTVIPLLKGLNKKANTRA